MGSWFFWFACVIFSFLRRTRIKQKIYHRDLISMKIILSTTLFLFLLFLCEKNSYYIYWWCDYQNYLGSHRDETANESRNTQHECRVCCFFMKDTKIPTKMYVISVRFVQFDESCWHLKKKYQPLIFVRLATEPQTALEDERIKK